MKYVFFVSREIWPSFNSIYAYTAIKNFFPLEFLAIYTDDKNMRKVEKMLRALYAAHEKNFEIVKIRVRGNSVLHIEQVIQEHLSTGDVIDITGARKLMILSLLHLNNVKIVYLLLRDMRFSGKPFMMRPVSLQEMMEVSI